MWKTVETKAGKTGVAKKKEKEAKKETEKKAEKQKKRKQKRKRTLEVKRIAEEWEIWDKGKEAVKSEAEAKNLVPEKFHR